MNSAIEQLGEVVWNGVGYVADLVAKIISRISNLAPLVLVVGCQGPSVTPNVKPIENKPAAMIQDKPVIESEDPKPLGQFTITFYYVIGEDEVGPRIPRIAEKPSVANDNVAAEPAEPDSELTAIAPDQVGLYEAGSCKEIAEVSHEFASQLAIQGTGKLRDGRVLNIWGRCSCERTPCFKVTENQWGTAGSNKPLQPFRTVAVDPKVVKLGTLLYLPLLEGRTMPGRAPWGGFIHDGCVVADDTGGHIDGNRLDLFVGRKAYFLGLSGSGSSHAWARHVPIYDGSKICERKGRHVGRKTGAI